MGEYFDRRADRRWQRQMRKRLKHLEREYGPIEMYGAPPRRRRWRETGPVLPGLAIALGLTAVVMVMNPGATGYRVRDLIDTINGRDDGAYTFLATERGSSMPVGWSPCEPITYVVNPEGAPADHEDLVADAIELLEEESEFEFDDGGETDDRTFTLGAREPGDPVLIGWATPDEVPALRGDTIGVGGSSTAPRQGRPRFVTGSVALDGPAYRTMARQGDGDQQRLVLVHELVHVLGLDHVDDRDQLMYPQYIGQDGLGEGDRAGLAELHELPC
ncbi:matrixin family metalloprotease [Nocardioides sp. SYSU D00038]|uniref:matrixin family metalloprotease n=1 Tax=Nocardioides sp. SYSU D00038 TaxID=2812554 RepID=UPI001967707E|nr:matrixin family metalloprotease [Nocardioides sp. SYSU D00038]